MRRTYIILGKGFNVITDLVYRPLSENGQSNSILLSQWIRHAVHECSSGVIKMVVSSG